MDLNITIHDLTRVTAYSSGTAEWITLQGDDDTYTRIVIHTPTETDKAGKVQWLRDFAHTILRAVDQPGTEHTIGGRS